MGELVTVVDELVVDDRDFFCSCYQVIGDYFVTAAAIPVKVCQVVLADIYFVDERGVGGEEVTAGIGLGKQLEDVGYKKNGYEGEDGL